MLRLRCQWMSMDTYRYSVVRLKDGYSDLKPTKMACAIPWFGLPQLADIYASLQQRQKHHIVLGGKDNFTIVGIILSGGSN